MQITQNMERSYSSDACKLHEWTVYTDVMWNGTVKQDVNKGQWLLPGSGVYCQASQRQGTQTICQWVHTAMTDFC